MSIKLKLCFTLSGQGRDGSRAGTRLHATSFKVKKHSQKFYLFFLCNILSIMIEYYDFDFFKEFSYSRRVCWGITYLLYYLLVESNGRPICTFWPFLWRQRRGSTCRVRPLTSEEGSESTDRTTIAFYRKVIK